jgi:hypothetical protein
LLPVYLGVKSFLGYKNKELLVVAIVATLIAAYFSYSQITVWEGFNAENMSMKSLNQELAREAVGLAIMAFGMLVYYVLPITKKE